MNFFETVYKIVSEIPTGKVISYGGVARLAGNPRMARQVGWALHVNPYQGVVPVSYTHLTLPTNSLV